MTMNEIYLTDIWGKALDFIKSSASIDQIVYQTYFVETKLFELNEKKAIISVATNLQKVVLTNELPLIQSSLEEILSKPVDCEIMLERETNKISSFSTKLNKDESNKEDNYDSHLLNSYTFENFVVGTSNRESHAASLACAYNPGKFYNPLFIYGNSGLGKTHLLNAIGNYVRSNDPTKKIMYISSSDFVMNIVNSIKDGKIEQFKDVMKNLDVLLMDDVQFLAGKEKSHEIFFDIFNELVNNRKQICITSDRHPTEIKGLEERLISRFSSGLSVGVDSPEFETSVAILKMKLENQSVDPTIIDDDVLSYLASNFSKDVRKLEGALNRILFFSINFSNGSNRIDFNTAINAFKGQVATSDKNELNINKIKRCVCDYYGLTKQQLVSKTRTKNIASARHIAMYLCRKFLDLPFVKIGEEFGKRDHSTVISACEKVELTLKNNIQYQQAIAEIEKIIKN